MNEGNCRSMIHWLQLQHEQLRFTNDGRHLSTQTSSLGGKAARLVRSPQEAAAEMVQSSDWFAVN